MHVAIDATNIRQGGGITHLSQLIGAADPLEAGVSHITLWACKQTADLLPNRSWLTKLSPPWAEVRWLGRMLGQQFLLGREITNRRCDVLFSPGCTTPIGLKVPVVVMSQNMLPFEKEEALYFGRYSMMRLKMGLLALTQSRSIRKAQGVVFLSNYARDAISNFVGGLSQSVTTIPHGIDSRFLIYPRQQEGRLGCGNKELKLLYVSTQMPYKHHLELMQAVTALRRRGRDVTLKMVGSHVSPYSCKLARHRSMLDPQNKFLQDLGHIDFSRLHEVYEQSDMFVFASSCENLPNILIEAMAAGLPIACSQKGPMPEVLGDAGLYFEPTSPASIEHAILTLADDPRLREQLARRAWLHAQSYSWELCARSTFRFVTQIARQHSMTSTLI